MSMFAYFFPMGIVPAGTVIPHQWFEHVEQNLVKAPNFTDGSTHAPSSPVTVGGAGMTIRMVGTSTLVDAFEALNGAGISFDHGSFFSVGGDAVFDGTSTVGASSGSVWTFDAGSHLNSNGTATFTGPTGFVGLSASSIQVADSLYTAPDSATNLNGTLHVSQGATFAAVANFNSDVLVLGATNMRGAYADNIVVGGPMEVGGVAQFDQPVVFSGVGRMRRRAAILSGAGSGTINPGVATEYLAQGLTGRLTVQIVEDAATADGDELYVFNPDPTYEVDIRNPSGAALGGVISVANSFDSMRFKRIGGSWYVIGRTGLAPRAGG